MTVDADEWIQTWCYRSEREKKKILDHSAGYTYSKLTGRLDLYHFVNLEEIIIFDNKLEVIEIGRLSKLRKIDLHNNKLTSLNVSNNLALESLDVRGNQIVANLSIFSHLVNLKELKLGVITKENKISSFNDFSGSLGSLGKLENLEHLDISQQVNIEPGYLELFPANKLKDFVCQGTVFEEQLRPLNFNVRAWQIDNDLKIQQEAMKVMDTHYREKIVVGLNNKIQVLKNDKKVLGDKLIKNAEIIQKALEELGNNISNQDYFSAQNLSNLNQIIVDCQEITNGRCWQLENQLLETQKNSKENNKRMLI
jgi:hypothetical protein